MCRQASKPCSFGNVASSKIMPARSATQRWSACSPSVAGTTVYPSRRNAHERRSSWSPSSSTTTTFIVFLLATSLARPVSGPATSRPRCWRTADAFAPKPKSWRPGSLGSPQPAPQRPVLRRAGRRLLQIIRRHGDGLNPHREKRRVVRPYNPPPGSCGVAGAVVSVKNPWAATLTVNEPFVTGTSGPRARFRVAVV
jgi:hypothetical protein